MARQRVTEAAGKLEGLGGRNKGLEGFNGVAGSEIPGWGKNKSVPTEVYDPVVCSVCTLFYVAKCVSGV